MKFVDYKCLESLLIEGEEMIATEGIGSAISGIAKRIFGMISGFINTIIGIFRGLINKLRGKKPKKFTSEELKKMGVDTFEPDTFKHDTFKPESNKSEPDKIKVDKIDAFKGERFVAIGNASEDALDELRIFVMHICAAYMKIIDNKSDDISNEIVNKLNDHYKQTSEKIDDYITKCNNNPHNTITSKQRDHIIVNLQDAIATLEKYEKRANDFKNDDMNALKNNEKELLNLVIKLIPKAQNYATKMTVIINNCGISG